MKNKNFTFSIFTSENEPKYSSKVIAFNALELSAVQVWQTKYGLTYYIIRSHPLGTSTSEGYSRALDLNYLYI